MASSENKTPSPEPFDAGPFDELLDWEGESFDWGVWSSSEEATGREGLPAHYKMRHDAHYVDELLSTKAVRQVIRVPVPAIVGTPDEGSNVGPLADSIAELGVLQPLIVRRHHGRYELVAGARRLAAARAAGLADVPCLLYDVDDHQAQRLKEATNLHGSVSIAEAMFDKQALLRSVFPLLGQSLQTIQRLGGSGGGARDRGASDLIRAEAHKATRLMWRATLISSTPNLTLTVFDSADVLEEVLRICDAEHTLTGLKLHKSIDDRCKLRADRSLVSGAMRSAVDTVLPLARARRVATVAVRLARHEPSRSVVLQVSQDGTRPADSAWGRWFDLRWRERPGGMAAGVALLAAKRVSELHGGRLAIAPRHGGGCRLILCFPEAAFRVR
jgi:hypothetical protein